MSNPIARRPFQNRVAIIRTIAPLLLGIFLWNIPSSLIAGDSVQLKGIDGTAQTWTVARIKQVLAAEIKTIDYTSRGQKHTSTAVPLLALLKTAGAPVDLKMDPRADPHAKNFNLRLAVVVQGGDGYTATFSLGELLPEIGGREAWLAFDEDAKPLPERDGLMKLIVPADLKPARWVRNVSSIIVADPSAAATRPAEKAADR